MDLKGDFGTASVPGRVGSAEEIAEAAVFLVLDDSCFVSAYGRLTDGGNFVARQRKSAGGMGPAFKIESHALIRKAIRSARQGLTRFVAL
ncbi:hypothetical protein DYH55_18340 [Methylovirgula sp. 4M-Z18]|nr:hypothetical protein DYH55_18340 [Methylovirgula sp. 4M-Z18]